jgi:hypothetical protein
VQIRRPCSLRICLSRSLLVMRRSSQAQWSNNWWTCALDAPQAFACWWRVAQFCAVWLCIAYFITDFVAITISALASLKLLIRSRQSCWEATSSLVDQSAHPTEPPAVEGVQWSIGGIFAGTSGMAGIHPSFRLVWLDAFPDTNGIMRESCVFAALYSRLASGTKTHETTPR